MRPAASRTEPDARRERTEENMVLPVSSFVCIRHDRIKFLVLSRVPALKERRYKLAFLPDYNHNADIREPAIMIEDDKIFRHLFADDGTFIARCYLAIGGSLRHGYSGRVALQHSQGKYLCPEDEDQILARYPELVALNTFMEGKSLKPESIGFKNLCARAGIRIPPIFNEEKRIYSGEAIGVSMPCQGDLPVLRTLEQSFRRANSGGITSGSILDDVIPSPFGNTTVASTVAQLPHADRGPLVDYMLQIKLL